MTEKNNAQKVEVTLCAPCQDLVGKGRSTKPHASLVLTSSRQCSSMIGSADETYYTCKTCGNEWLYETGTCSYGWIV